MKTVMLSKSLMYGSYLMFLASTSAFKEINKLETSTCPFEAECCNGVRWSLENKMRRHIQHTQQDMLYLSVSLTQPGFTIKWSRTSAMSPLPAACKIPGFSAMRATAACKPRVRWLQCIKIEKMLVKLLFMGKPWLPRRILQWSTPIQKNLSTQELKSRTLPILEMRGQTRIILDQRHWNRKLWAQNCRTGHL